MPRLQPGKYTVTVKDAYMAYSSKGTPGITFDFICPEGYIDCTRWVTENAAEYTLKDLETLGFPPAMLADMANLERIGELTKGNEVEITVEDEEYNGEVRSKVRWINPVGSGPGMRRARPEETHTLWGILARQAGVSAARTVVPGPRDAQRPPSAPMPLADDESVPF